MSYVWVQWVGDYMGPYYSILQIWVHDMCHPQLLACYTCACDLMSLVIPMLISHHVDIDGQPFWIFRMVRAHEHSCRMSYQKRLDYVTEI